MSTRVYDILTDAALNLSDPSFSQVSAEQMLALYNQVARDIASRVNLVRYTATFDLDTDGAYSYPQDATQVIEVAVTETPSDADSYRSLEEMNEEGFRASTYGAYPSGTPVAYWPDVDVFRLWPKPAAAVNSGGRVRYWGMPDTAISATNDLLPFPDFTRSWVTEALVFKAKTILRQYAESAADYSAWLAKNEQDWRERAEDRSVDRRQRITPRSTIVGTRGMV